MIIHPNLNRIGVFDTSHGRHTRRDSNFTNPYETFATGSGATIAHMQQNHWHHQIFFVTRCLNVLDLKTCNPSRPN
jgi:hypothetical protein